MPEVLSHEKDGVLVLQFTAQKILSDPIIAQIGRELLLAADQVPDGKLLIDFSGVIFVSAAIIGKLVLLNKKCACKRFKLCLCSVAPSIKEVFEMTRLDRQIAVYENEAAALSVLSRK